MTGIRREIAAIDPNLALFDVRTLDEFFDITKSYMRVALNIYGGIGVFGLVLAAIGLAGVTGYAVARGARRSGSVWRSGRARDRSCGWCCAKARRW